MISICVPTRNRPELFKRMCQSVLNTVDNPKGVEFSIYRDEDDQSGYEYFGNYKLITGKRIWPGASYNECWKNATGPIYLFCTDDTIFLSKGWDTMMEGLFNQSVDKIIFVYFNDGLYRRTFGEIGALHKNWCDTVGYFFDPRLIRRGDVTINLIARTLRKRVFMRPMRIKLEKVVNDKTHIEYYDEIVKSGNLGFFRSRMMSKERKKAVEKLQTFINEHSNGTVNPSAF